jgi:hypothetical protein
MRMTSRERLLAAMHLEEVDRVPIHMRGVHVWNPQWLESRHESYRPVIEAVQEHCDLVAFWGPGGGLLFTASSELRFETEVLPGDDWDERITTMHTPRGTLTSRHLSSNRGLPGLQTEFYVKTLDDVDKVLSVPYEPPQPDVRPFVELTASMGERGVVMCSLVDPITPVHGLMGSELLAIWSRQERGIIGNLVGMFAERIADLVKHLLKQHVGPVFASLGQEFAIPPLMSPRDFTDFCTIPEAPIGEMIHDAGCLLHVHCHGAMDAVLEDFITIGANCLHPIEAPPMGDLTLAEAKRRVGGHICLEGNIQIGDVYAAPTEVIVEQTRAAIRDAGPTGFILCPTASPHTEVLPDQAVRNYTAIIETARELA